MFTGELNMNEKKSWRRVTAALAGTVLVTVAFYYTVGKGASFEWFQTYAMIVFGFLLLLIPGLTVTDVMGKK
jgi:hypothetical protein